MKKIVAVAGAVVLTLAMSISAFAAGTIDANEQKIIDELKAKNVPAQYISQAENYLAQDDVTVSAADVEKIIANIDSAAEKAKAAGITSVQELKNNKEVLDSILKDVDAAAAVLDIKVDVNVKNGNVVAKKNETGKIVATTEVGTKKTGADSMTGVATVAALGLAVAAVAVVAKKNEREA